MLKHFRLLLIRTQRPLLHKTTVKLLAPTFISQSPAKFTLSDKSLNLPAQCVPCTVQHSSIQPQTSPATLRSAATTSTLGRIVAACSTLATTCCVSLVGLLLTTNQPPSTSTKTESADQSTLLPLIEEARKLIAAQRPTEARQRLHEALRQCDAEGTTTTKTTTDALTVIYDLLVNVEISDGRIAVAEELLVRFIERLQQLGVRDTDNRVVRYRLKLSRLYQVVGNTPMAEIGYRSCVSAQEAKLTAAVTDSDDDRLTHQLYLSALFWYGRFLTEGSDLVRAQSHMRRALEHDRRHSVLQPAQLMVFLFHSAEISFRLQQYDDSLLYLTQAVDVCMSRDPDNAELPIYLVKMGIVFYRMELYEEAQYWCEKGRHFARLHKNRQAEEEAEQCLGWMRSAGVGGTSATCKQ